MKSQLSVVLAAVSLAVGLAACDQPTPTDPQMLEAKGATGYTLDLSICAPGQPGFTIVSTNPYFPMTVGHQLVLTGEDEGDEIRLQVTVLNLTRTIEGVVTRIVEEREWVNDELAEVTWNYHVQASDGTICYYGEDVDIFTDDGVSHEGAWCPGGPNHNLPGIFMPADPKPGTSYQNEVAPGVALDEAKIVGVGRWEVPLDTFEETIRIREFDPISGDKDYKVHAADVGIIDDGGLQLVEINQTSGTPETTLVLQACGS